MEETSRDVDNGAASTRDKQGVPECTMGSGREDVGTLVQTGGFTSKRVMRCDVVRQAGRLALVKNKELSGDLKYGGLGLLEH